MNYLQKTKTIIALSEELSDMLNSNNKKNNELIKIMINDLLKRLVELRKQLENGG